MKELLYNLKKKIYYFFRCHFTVNENSAEMQKSWLPDKIYLRKYYEMRMHKKLDLNNPKTQTEKLQWIKLYDRNPLYTKLVDKYSAREYIKNRVGEDYLIPLVGVWGSIDDIDFDALPEQFVFKCTHDGGVYIVKDKSIMDIEDIKRWLTFHLNRDYYKTQREWPYKNVTRRIICEQYMVDKQSESLIDFKFFCFNGEPKYLYVTQHINGREYINYFNDKFEPIQVKRNDLESLPNDFYRKPLTFEKMIKIAHELSCGLYWVRVDLYEINGKNYCGELTFFPTGGFIPYSTNEWDKKFGDCIVLPKKKRF